MSIVKETVWGESRDIVQIAIERIRTFEPPEGYYVAFSGGKDSIVILDLVRRAGVKHDAHMNMTSIDPPELVRFVKQNYPDVIRHKPVTTMWKLIEKKMMPPTRLVRYCCEVLKEGGGEDRLLITGVRWDESNKRRTRKMVESCIKSRTKRFLHPIIDWTDEDVWEYIKVNDLLYCPLYDQGFKRIGCIGCPMSGKGRLIEFERWPRIKKMYIKAFDAAVKKRREVGFKYEGHHLTWSDGDAMFDWWMEENLKATDDDQCVLFE